MESIVYAPDGRKRSFGRLRDDGPSIPDELFFALPRVSRFRLTTATAEQRRQAGWAKLPPGCLLARLCRRTSAGYVAIHFLAPVDKECIAAMNAASDRDLNALGLRMLDLAVWQRTRPRLGVLQ